MHFNRLVENIEQYDVFFSLYILIVTLYNAYAVNPDKMKSFDIIYLANCDNI